MDYYPNGGRYGKKIREHMVHMKSNAWTEDSFHMEQYPK